MFCLTLFFLMAYTIATLNVNGLKDYQKRDMIFDYFVRKKTAIIFLQETHSEETDEPLWRKQWGGQIIFSHGNNNSRGVAILTSRKCGLNIVNPSSDSEGRWVKGEVEIDGNTISLFSLYAPNVASDRKRFFVHFGNIFLNVHTNDNCIIAGDLNCQLDSNIIYDQSKISLRNFIQENELIDIWRHTNNKPGFTFYHKIIKRPSRIDYVLMSDTLGNQFKEISVDSSGLSDHSTVLVRLDNKSIPMGKGRWICNNELFKDDQCKIRVEWFWNYWSTQKNHYNCLFDWWDTGKNRLKEIIKDYDIEKQQNEKHRKNVLQKRYDYVINKSNSSDDDVNELKEIERQLKLYEKHEWEKAKIRLHTNKKVEGEKPSKYFFSAEKQQQKNNAFKYFEDTEGHFIDQPIQMLEHVRKFYSNLFSTNGVNNFHMKKILDTVTTTFFEDEITQDMEKDIEERELYQALNDMNKNKAPGLDGLTVEFYLTFWYLIKNDFVELIDYCKRNVCLPDSMNVALIRLLYKNRGDRSDLKNWRPISLLNVDYKIISKVLTKRLRKLMPSLINEEQTCGVQGRNIQDNLMVLRDITDYVNINNKKAAILSIDQEKAFDRIEWRYMHAIMNKMGIPYGLRLWIKILYSNPMVTINCNNFLTEPFSATRGIRQGCSLSPLLYSICVEGLANLIRSNNNIKGIELPGQQVNFKVVQHADDTSIFITDNKDFNYLKKVFYTYSEGSGSKINIQKTQGLWLGAWKNRNDNPGNFKWTNKQIKILGIYFGNEVNPEDNWTERVNRMKNVLNRWKERSLTMKGKAIVVNSFIGGSLAYFGSVLHCPNSLIQKMNDTIMKFYWSDKPDKIKRDTIRGPSNLGGTGLINIAYKLDALKLTWLQKYTKTQRKWKYLFDYWISKANNDKNFNWYVFSNTQLTGSKMPIFYRDLINAFRNTDGRLEPIISCYNEAYEIPLWNNTVITGSNKILDYKLLKSYGILTLKHVMTNGNFFTTSELAIQCNIKPINAGKLIAGLKRHINDDIIRETREGPANHVSNWLIFELQDQDIVSVSDISAKQIYQSKIKKAFIPPAAEEKWPIKLSICKNSLDWNEIWKKANNKSIDYDDKDLWFRLRHRILPTKDFLFKCHMDNDNKCGLCKQEVETFEHLFIYCNRTWPSWNFVENIMRKYLGNKHFYLNDSNRILGYGNNINAFALFLIAKLHRTIWVNRCHNLSLKSPVTENELLISYQKNLKRILILEQQRLSKNDFINMYTKNRALCYLEEMKIIFTI